VNRLSVRETVAFAYRFTFQELGTIIGLIWLPMVAIGVLEFLPYGLGDANLTADQDPNALGAAALRGIVFWLVSVLFYACVNVAVVRQALGLRKGTAVAYFNLGRAEFRVWGALLLLLAILFALILGLALAVIAAGAAAQALGGQVAAALAATVVLVAGLCVLLVSMLRLGFLLVPIAVVEEKISFERGWLLTQGNFWRIAAVLFVVTLPTFAVLTIASSMLMGHELDALAHVASRLSVQAVMERYRLVVSGHAPELIGINLILAPFTFGLTLGACAAGYRALTAARKLDASGQVS
jgi:hypothetical protein